VILGLLADVHANLPALDAALDALAGADRLVCAGDLVGYGAQPDACVARLAEAGVKCVAGNHDLVAATGEGLERCDALAATTLRWTIDALSDDTRSFLAALPGEVAVGDVLVTHGAPGDPWHYVREPADAAAQLARRPAARVLVVGHTHRPLAVDAGGLAARPADVALGAGRWLLNPGAVGQSRERRLHVRVALLDLDAGRVSFRTVPYDVRAARAALGRAGLPPEAIHRRPPLRDLVRRRR
jgi:predicted phosphodiesterase